MMQKRIYYPLPLSVPLPNAVVVLALHHDLEGFRILLEEHCYPPTYRRIRIGFSSTPFALRMMDESDYLLTIGRSSGVISIVENSEFLQWFHSESQNVRAEQNLRHYAIYTTNECFDIIHSETPEVVEL